MKRVSAPRVIALDTLRGLLIVLMIAEHARQILGGGVRMETPGTPIPAVSADAASLIRLLSHLCAPGFFLLLGIGMALHLEQHAYPLTEARRRFFKRGALLILLQVTVENLGWGFPMLLRAGSAAHAAPLYLGVLFGLGASLIVAAALPPLADAVLLALAAGMIASAAVSLPPVLRPWMGWLTSGFFGARVEILYPVLPWSGITLLGLLAGRRCLCDRSSRTAGFPLPLLAALAVVAVWSIGTLLAGGAALSGWYKYPPSPLFVLGTLSLLMLLLALLAAVPRANLRPLQLLGRHALALYLAHLYLLGIVSLWVYPASMQQTLAIAAGVGVLGAGWCRWRERLARPAPAGNRFDRYSRHYDRFMRLARLNRVGEIRHALTGVRAEGHLLDVGGGTGYLASRLTDLFARIVVVDPSAGMLSLARRRNLPTCQASALALPFADGEFDAVLCTDALHHIKQAGLAIAEMCRVLKPGGRLVILEFHIRGPAGWLFFAFERLLLDRSEFLTPDQLRVLLERQGLPGTTLRISRLQYLYVGQKPGGDASR